MSNGIVLAFLRRVLFSFEPRRIAFGGFATEGSLLGLLDVIRALVVARVISCKLPRVIPVGVSVAAKALRGKLPFDELNKNAWSKLATVCRCSVFLSNFLRCCWTSFSFQHRLFVLSASSF